MLYHVMGSIAAATFLITVLGLIYQLRLVLQRKRAQHRGTLPQGERPTSILSLNQLASLYLAVFAFFLYGISLDPMNHYLAWPRFLAALVAIAIVYQMVLDRRDAASLTTLSVMVVLLLGSPLILWIEPSRQYTGVMLAQGLVLAATFVLGQGYYHQIRMIRVSGRTGAVSLRFHQCVLLTALSTIGFGAAMGLAEGWPLMLLASVSATLKIITLWQFRWVRLSPLARARRETSAVAPAT